MSTIQERAAAAALLDIPVARGCSCGCLHLLEVESFGQHRPIVRFRCQHTEHLLDGHYRTYTNPPNDGAVLDEEIAVDADQVVAPLLPL